jgi:uncharacterized integral membrane protein (TIGR00697 family)
MLLDTRTRFFLILAGTFVTCLIVGDLIGGRLYGFELAGLDLAVSAGMIPFPVTFLLTDLINEFYGKRLAKFVTLLGFGMAVLTLVIVFVADAIPSAPFTAIADGCYTDVFTDSLRIFAASLASYLAAQMTDILVFHWLKRVTANRFLWLRATGSTAASQLIDTVAIQSLAWIGTPQESLIPQLIITSYVVKLLVAIALTPAIYAGHALIERRFELKPIRLGPDGEPLPEFHETRPLDVHKHD